MQPIVERMFQTGRVTRSIQPKRTLDVALGAVLSFLVLPVAGIIVLVIKLTSRGPVLFRQQRVGQNGRLFVLYKFRTMHEGADPERHVEAFKGFVQGVRAHDQPPGIFKLRRDSRITPVGSTLRRLGLDELPQFINVLKGDMSLVGPRPALAYEVELYGAHHERRLTVQPGITGLWQVRGRDRVDFETMIAMDLDYIDRQSLWLDLTLLLVTGPAILWAMLRDFRVLGRPR